MNYDKLEESQEMIFVIINLNARLQPIHRGEFFEDLFEEVLAHHGIGTVTGGGTLQKPSGEICNCDIEINIRKNQVSNFLSFLNKVDIIPKGSKLEYDDNNVEIGSAEGLALYLNRNELSEEVYKNNDVNILIGELEASLGDTGQWLSYWEGGMEIGLYYYGKSFIEMKEKMSYIIQSHPLCEKCRIEHIA